MRKKIQQLAEGRFDYDNYIPDFSLSVNKIELEVLEGRDESGFFEITGRDEKKIRGVVYSDNPRMECLTPQFEGNCVKIRYQFHSEGLCEGDILKGEFCIVSSQGEYSLSFVVSVTKLYADSSVGKIRNMDDFLRLVRSGSEEACRLFYSNNFRNILGRDKERFLYEGIVKQTPSRQNVEEFLAATGWKRRVELSLTGNHAEFSDISGRVCEQVVLQKKNWGAIDLTVQAEGDFLFLDKEHYTETDFLGSSLSVAYYIDTDHMHAGKNYGRLLFQAAGWSDSYEILACAGQKADEGDFAEGKEERERRREERREQKQGRKRLMELYIQFRLKKIVTGAWAKQSISILDHLQALEPEQELWNLMKAQALLVNRQKQEASWILTEFKRNYMEHHTPAWGYYLYLCTLMEREESYVDRLSAEIEQIYYKNPENPLLFWILLLVKKEYCNHNSQKFKAIREWIEKGNSSPVFYLEAYYLLWQDSYLLSELGSFEVKILRWVVRWDVLTRDMALQVKQLLPQQRSYNDAMKPVLEKCFEADTSDEMLVAICGYLIRGQRFDRKYHKWYELGVAQKLRITGLYEAFLFSMDREHAVAIPKTMQIYFQYKSDLSYENMTLLYDNIIAAKGKQPGVYQKYRRNIEQFGIRQLETGRIDENLAVIYNDIFPSILIDEEIAKQVAAVLFTRKLVCRREKIVSACIIQRECSTPQEIRIVNGAGYFLSCVGEEQILLFDADGNCFADPGDYDVAPLFAVEDYITRCMELAPKEIPCLRYYFSRETGRKEEGWNDAYLDAFLEWKELRPVYKNALLMQQIAHELKSQDAGKLEKYANDITFESLLPREKTELIRIMLENRMYERACTYLRTEGYDFLEDVLKVRLCSYCIDTYGTEEEDDILGLADACFRAGKYNDAILDYLCMHYNGPTKQMAKLWTAAVRFARKTDELEERILVQALYSSEYIENIDEIYESYRKNCGKKMVCMAYLSFFAQEYVVSGAIIPDHVFTELSILYGRDEELNDACKIGLLEHLAEKDVLSVEEEQMADRLLNEYISRKMYFPFYAQFSGRLAEKYQLLGRTYVTYYGRPKEQIWIAYRRNDEMERRELLTEMYGGIYVKSFLLFYGDTLAYSVLKKEQQEWKRLEEHAIAGPAAGEKDRMDRFSRLNRMAEARERGDQQALKQQMMQYQAVKELTESLFHIL